MAERRAPIDRVPPQVKSYLFDWRNFHNEEFLKRFEGRGLKQLTIHEIEKLFREAVEEDKRVLGSVMQLIETEDSYMNP